MEKNLRWCDRNEWAKKAAPNWYSPSRIWAIYSDLSRGHPKWWFSKGTLPNMAETFRLRIYNILPRKMNMSTKKGIISKGKDRLSVPIPFLMGFFFAELIEERSSSESIWSFL